MSYSEELNEKLRREKSNRERLPFSIDVALEQATADILKVLAKTERGAMLYKELELKVLVEKPAIFDVAWAKLCIAGKARLHSTSHGPMALLIKPDEKTEP